MVTAVAKGRPTQPNINSRHDKTNNGEITVGIVANYQFDGTGRPDIANPRPCCEVVLMLEISEASVNVRGFNTTLSQELDAQWGYPFQLSYLS